MEARDYSRAARAVIGTACLAMAGLGLIGAIMEPCAATIGWTAWWSAWAIGGFWVATAPKAN